METITRATWSDMLGSLDPRETVSYVPAIESVYLRPMTADERAMWSDDAR